jgi:hypothetical protein
LPAGCKAKSSAGEQLIKCGLSVLTPPSSPEDEEERFPRFEKMRVDLPCRRTNRDANCDTIQIYPGPFTIKNTFAFRLS